ncbi:MAG: hypothetical protein RBU45_12240 [Myxococcota bacterium]|nr:hypothetical protein [Myxococcota bacterium]
MYCWILRPPPGSAAARVVRPGCLALLLLLGGGAQADPPPDPTGPPPGPTSPPGATDTAPHDTLRSEIALLGGLLRGELPEEPLLTALIEIDLADEAAVEAARRLAARRVQELTAQRQRWLAPPPAAAPPKASPDAGQPVTDHGTGAADAGAGPADQETKEPGLRQEKPIDRPKDSTTTERHDGGIPPSPPPPTEDAGVPAEQPAAAPPPSAAQVALLELQREREQLRVQLFELPRATRLKLVQVAAERQRVRQEQEAAALARREADLAAQRAEAARREALAESRRTADHLARELSLELARVEAARGAIATLRGELAQRRQQENEAEAARLSEEQELRRRLAPPDLPPTEADRLYDTLVERLQRLRQQLHQALDELAAPSAQPAFSPQIDTTQPPYQQPSLPRAALRHGLSALTEETLLLAREEREQRFRRAAGLAASIDTLNQERTRLLSRLSPAKRDLLLGLTTREGLQQLGRELGDLRLAARWFPHQRWHSLRDWGQALRDPVNLGLLSWRLLELALLVGLLLFLRPRYQSWLQLGRNFLVSRVKGRSAGLLIDGWLAFGVAIAREIGILLFCLALFALLEPDGVAELALLRTLVLGYAWYRLALAAAHHLLTSRGLLRRIEVSPVVSERILASLRVLGRFLLVALLARVLIAETEGPGYLYELVSDLFLLGLVPVVLLLIYRWRDDIADAFLRIYPQSRLAGLVARTRGQRLGFFVALLAFGGVAARGLTESAKNLLLGFEQTRRALAFLFRRQLERQAETRGHGQTDVQQLPATLRAAFADGLPDEAAVVPRWPHHERLQAMLEAWQQQGRSCVVALVGAQGVGKSSYLVALQRRHPEQRPLLVRIPGHLSSPADLLALLRERLGLPPTEDLPGWLAHESPRLILLDGCEQLYLRVVGGGAGFEALATLIAATAPRHAWVCAFGQLAWDRLHSQVQGLDPFDQAFALPTWSEAEIGELIARRMAISGFSCSYEDLLLDSLDGRAIHDEVVRTGERFRRLLWDYADGNPRTAMHYWLRSLVPADEGEVRVHLFRTPDVTVLEELAAPNRFLLTALLLHRSLTAAEASRVLRHPEEGLVALLRNLQRLGIVEETEPGSYGLSPGYTQPVMRFLRRKHLIWS